MEKYVEQLLDETRTNKTTGARGVFKEVEGFAFFVDIKKSTQTFEDQRNGTYLKFMHSFYGGIYKILKDNGLEEDSIKFLGDGVLGILKIELSPTPIFPPFLNICKDITALIEIIRKKLGATENRIIEGVRFATASTTTQNKIYRGKTGVWGDSRIEYHGLPINYAVKLTKEYIAAEGENSLRMLNWNFIEVSSNNELNTIYGTLYEYKI